MDVLHGCQLSRAHQREFGPADGSVAAEVGDVVPLEKVGVDGHGQERGFIVDAATGAKQFCVGAKMMDEEVSSVAVDSRGIVVTRERELEDHVSNLRRSFEERRG